LSSSGNDQERIMAAKEKGPPLFIQVMAVTICLFVTGPATVSATNIDPALSECAGIEKADDRLACFDRLTRQFKKEAPTDIQKTKAADPREQDQLSVLERHWDLKVENRRHAFILRPYRMNYFLPVAYNSSPNDEMNLEYNPTAKAQFNEAKFQLSFKVKICEDLLQKPLQKLYDKNIGVKGIDIWMAYTQYSFWQLYNSAFSAPFRDTNYEPEALITFRSQVEIPGLMGTKLQYFNIGFNHQSNGRSRPLSRSWNRIVGNIGLEKGDFNMQLKTWYRLPEDEAEDDNSDVIRFMGYGELWMTYFWEKQRFALMLRNNLRQNNLGAVQLDWSIPPYTLGKLLQRSGAISQATLDNYFSDKFSLYVQYFNGYGEGLMDYNKSINRISAGVMLAEWN
jgi:phospholipase A1